MARSAATDTQFLEKKNGKWRVVVPVPRSLHGELPTKLKRSLGTDSLATANVLKWPVVAELKAAIAKAQGSGGKDPISREALAMLAQRRLATTPEELDNLDIALAIRAEQISGPRRAVEDVFRGDGDEAVDPDRERQARIFVDMATGSATPLSEHHGDYLKHARVKARTEADDKRALRYLEAWCEKAALPRTLEAITKRVAVRFLDGLGEVAKGRSNTTLQKYVNRLNTYWKWMERREYVDRNVWQGLKLPKEIVDASEEERPFTSQEMLDLLAGPAPDKLRDVMLIGALTGARLDPIVDLKVKDCANGAFIFKPQKREKKERLVPIHSALLDLVKRRTDGRAPDDPLFPEWPAPVANSLRERSFKTSNAFTAYRRSVGVDEKLPGRRRSLVNFHSFRRWFITQAERAGQPENIIAAVVGHKRQGMTLGRYSAGPLIAQARACVEAVRLPNAKPPRGEPKEFYRRKVVRGGQVSEVVGWDGTEGHTATCSLGPDDTMG